MALRPTTPDHLDHLVYAGPDLEQAVAQFTERTGVRPVPGGSHPGGTANYLVALTVGGVRVRSYLEIVGPDPDHPGTRPITLFGIHTLRGPRLVTFAVRPPNPLATVSRARAGGYDPGPLDPLSRRTPTGGELHWRLSHPPTEPTVIPFLIAWGETEHPALNDDLPSLELLELYGQSPHAQRDRHVLQLLDVNLPLAAATETRLVARLNTPAGRVELT